VRRPVHGHVATLTLFTALSPTRSHEHRIARYLLVGAVSFLLDAGSIWLGYRVVHLPIAMATSLGFIAGLAFNFTASKMFTFRVRSDIRGQTLRYAVLLAVNYLTTLVIVSASELWGPGYVVGKICAAGLVTTSTYFVLGHWVFVTPGTRRVSRSFRLAKDNMQDVGES
jgi:putative flippase GtrA